MILKNLKGKEIFLLKLNFEKVEILKLLLLFQPAVDGELTDYCNNGCFKKSIQYPNEWNYLKR